MMTASRAPWHVGTIACCMISPRRLWLRTRMASLACAARYRPLPMPTQWEASNALEFQGHRAPCPDAAPIRSPPPGAYRKSQRTSSAASPGCQAQAPSAGRPSRPAPPG
eukprot:6220529-Pyramimonas_sp.AAC.1